MSKLIVNSGSMFGGKTRELQRLGERHKIAGHNVLYLKPDFDNRYGKEHISTHDGNKVEAIPVSITDSIFNYITKDTEVVLIDEVQFFNSSIVNEIMELVENGVNVYVSGLDMDFQGNAFEATSELMALADEVNKFHAVCGKCGSDAIFSAKTNGNSSSRIEVGEKDKYIPLCRRCYYEFKKGDK